ncbi:sugar-phosphatase [Vagococcus elongatus]|uniref:Sugar-phosphatase n=1 Tax=Vagococcus elongatus TaxID=180344 RepID=A0A430ANH3_9ENTE|nr:sugar-phosphatase [Vagococcus elongatus]RSU09720.1 sugar-phosphatase [Vagococcus elongatus]
MSIKLVAIDIDGTLLNSHHQISKKTIDIIKQKRQEGLRIVLASGRPLNGMLAYTNSLGLTTEDDYIISYNGALAINSGTNEAFVKHTLNYDDLIEFYQLSQKLNVHSHFVDSKAIYTPNKDISPYTIHEAFLTKMPLFYKEIEEVSPTASISKYMIIDHEEIIDFVMKEIPQPYYDRYNIVRSADFFLEFLNKEASKGLTLKNLSDKLGIQQSEVMAIGDNENDISMLEYAGVGVAMGNATQTTKKFADRITLANDDEGVAHALEQWT